MRIETTSGHILEIKRNIEDFGFLLSIRFNDKEVNIKLTEEEFRKLLNGVKQL